MLIVLPPSETKASGGEGAPLDFESLSLPSLNETRRAIARDLVALPVDQALEVLGISEKLRPEAEANRALMTAPTMPAILRYTGVLFDALDAPSLPTKSWERLAIGSALFGVVGAQDMIPKYRLSGGTKLPTSDGELPTMKKRWGKAITEALQESEELILDLRSGIYQQLGRVPGAVTVRVESVQADGSRKVVSHFNKHYKGLVARELALSDAQPQNASEVAAAARDAGFVIEENEKKPLELTMVVEG
ncbi:peroxide stress protein YaaA [Corynebacterium pelargi]|uniref:UPF0246 protein CPELA_04355 n=1 Tax=Corynebacterium pelargi TaxID=1471400 RepID=A0A410W866_9CORY|nr:peroxide stress protein YaaA [Corynebacterium pelargi]QAU52150.1 hypothetical protein CPELA_04355 [Corynebacterium pelargi]GGG69795.1 UPF0246 protein Cgl1995/cg2186 [Corynebacterium pelargi]